MKHSPHHPQSTVALAGVAVRMVNAQFAQHDLVRRVERLGRPRTAPIRPEGSDRAQAVDASWEAVGRARSLNPKLTQAQARAQVRATNPALARNAGL